MKGDRISVTEAGWYHGARKPSSLGKGEGFFICGAAEKRPPASFSVRKHPQRSQEATPAVFSSPAASLESRFEQPAGKDQLEEWREVP